MSTLLNSAVEMLLNYICVSVPKQHNASVWKCRRDRGWLSHGKLAQGAISE